MKALLYALALAVAAPVSAQTVVSPSQFETAIVGVRRQNTPLGIGPGARTLQIHDDLMGTARVINGLSFRARKLPSIDCRACSISSSLSVCLAFHNFSGLAASASLASSSPVIGRSHLPPSSRTMAE